MYCTPISDDSGRPRSRQSFVFMIELPRLSTCQKKPLAERNMR
jgi:hypothetical protein